MNRQMKRRNSNKALVWFLKSIKKNIKKEIKKKEIDKNKIKINKFKSDKLFLYSLEVNFIYLI